MEMTYSTIWFYFRASKKLTKRNESFFFFIRLGFCLLNNMSFLRVVVVLMFCVVFFLYLLFSCFAFLVYDCLPMTTASTTGLEPGKRQSKTTMPLGKWLCYLAKKHVWQVYKPRWSWSSLSPSAFLERCQVGTSAKLISWVASPGLGKLVQVERNCSSDWTFAHFLMGWA